MDYLEEEVIPDFLGGECLVRPSRAPGLWNGDCLWMPGWGWEGGPSVKSGVGLGAPLVGDLGGVGRSTRAWLGRGCRAEGGWSGQAVVCGASSYLGGPVAPWGQRLF